MHRELQREIAPLSLVGKPAHLRWLGVLLVDRRMASERPRGAWNSRAISGGSAVLRGSGAEQSGRLRCSHEVSRLT